MPKETKDIEEVQQAIVKNISLQGLQLPSNIKKPLLGVDGEITRTLFITRISPNFLGFTNFEESLAQLAYNESDCGIWPILSERSYHASQISDAEINARLSNGLVFIVDVLSDIAKNGKDHEGDAFVGACYTPYALSQPIPVDKCRAILVPIHLLPMVQKCFPKTEIIPVDQIKHQVNPEISFISSNKVHMGANFHKVLHAYIQKNKSTKEFAIHAVRLPTTYDLLHHPALFEPLSPIRTYCLPPHPNKQVQATHAKLIEDQGGDISSTPQDDVQTFTIHSDKLNKQVRQQLGLDRVRANNFSPLQRERLSRMCPTSTIEPDWERKGAFLITFPEKQRYFIQSLLQEDKIVRLQAIYRGTCRLRTFFNQERQAIEETSVKIQNACKEHQFKRAAELSHEADELLTNHERLVALANRP